MDNFWNSELLKLHKQYAVMNSVRISEGISSEIKKFQSSIKYLLIKNNPFGEYLKELENAEQSLRQDIYDLSAIKSDFNLYKKLSQETRINITEEYWESEIAKLEKRQKDIDNSKKLESLLESKFTVKKTSENDYKEIEVEKKTLRSLMQQHWRKTFDQEYSRWELDAIAKYRRELLEKIKDWLERMQQLADALAQLGIEPGLLFDLSKNNLSFADIEKIKRWATYLSQDNGVRQLCELMGRLRVAKRAKRMEKIKTTAVFTETIPDIHSREEIVGVCIGNNIEHALPQELALLADEDTSLLFDIKFVENRLMCFDMEGWQNIDKTIEQETLSKVEYEEKMGPIIICVDTSGSMQGTPETIAKAITLSMTIMAAKQKRDCFLINFSTGIDTLDLSGDINMENLVKFLQKSFNGGTDAKPAIRAGLDKMKEDNYRKSDMLIISDFIMEDLPDELRKKISEAKKNDNKFYSLAIGDNLFLSKTNRSIFNNEWVYDPANYKIRQLLDIVADTIGN